MRHHSVVIRSLFAIGLLVLAGCSSAAAQAPNTKVSIQLGWTYDYSTSEFYTAVKNGHFSAQNLDVTLQEGGFVNGQYVDAVADVISGKADFGLSSDLSLLQARAEGKPVVAIATILQRSPEAVISLAKSNLRRPQDLIGHKVAIADGTAHLLFNAMLAAAQVDPTQVTVVPRTDYGIDPLLKGTVDALVGWTINEGVQVKQAGVDPSFMLFSDYGVESYNNLLFTTDQMIKDKSDIVKKFLTATIQGLTDVVKDPDKAVDYTLTYGTKLTRDDQTPRIQTMLPLISPLGTKPGMMDDATWKATYQLYLSGQALTKQVDVTTAYTLSFLKQIYQ